MNVDVVKTIPFCFTVSRTFANQFDLLKTTRELDFTNINFSPDLVELCNFDISVYVDITHLNPDPVDVHLQLIQIVFPFFDNLTINRYFYYDKDSVLTNITKMQNLSYDLKFTGKPLRLTEQVFINSRDEILHPNNPDLYISSLFMVISGMFKFIKYK